MKEKIKKNSKKAQKVIEVLCNIILLAMLLEETAIFIIQLFSGYVRTGDVIFALVLVIAITVVITELHNKKETPYIFKEYRMKITAAAILFVSKGQLTEHELKKFMSIMRYAARENKWEE